MLQPPGPPPTHNGPAENRRKRSRSRFGMGRQRPDKCSTKARQNGPGALFLESPGSNTVRKGQQKQQVRQGPTSPPETLSRLHDLLTVASMVSQKLKICE